MVHTKASAMATVDKTRSEKSDDQSQTQEKYEKMREHSRDKELFDKQAIKAGIATRDANGKMIATTGQKFTDGMAALGAGDMPSNSQVVIAGERLNVDTDIDGNTLVNRDSLETEKRGRSYSLSTSGDVRHPGDIKDDISGGGQVGDAVMYAGGTAFAADVAWRKFGPKGNEGFIKPAFKGASNKLATLVGGSEPFPKSPEDSVDGSSKSSYSEGTDDTNGKKGNNFEHGKTPRSTNYAAQPTENHPINQSESKGIVSKISEMFKSPKTEKLAEFAKKAFGGVHSKNG